MSCRPVDMHREEERKAAGMVERGCGNCEYNHSQIGEHPCSSCGDYSPFDNFTPLRAAISAKLEELQQMASKRDSASKAEGRGEKEGEESKENLMDEAIEYFDESTSLLAIMNIAYPERVARLVKHYPSHRSMADFLKSIKSERGEMIRCLKRVIKYNEDFMARSVTELDEICEDVEKIVKNAEGK